MAQPMVDIDTQLEGLNDALRDLEKMHDSITPKYLKTVQARKARKHFVPAMKRNSHSARLVDMISVTQAKKYTSRLGVRVGVVKNDPDKFPKFSAQALASVIEYGTAERYRQLKSLGLVTGRQSTGAMPAAPFLRPAWDSNVKAFMDDVEDAIIKKVQKETA